MVPHHRRAGALALAAAGLCWLVSTGCSVAGAGVAAATAVGGAFVKGEYKSTEAAPVYRVWLATLLTLDELGLPIERENFLDDRGYVTARRADGKPVHIEVVAQSPRITQVRIRVGTFGDRSFSEAIARQVGSNTEGPPPAVTAPYPSDAESPE